MPDSALLWNAVIGNDARLRTHAPEVAATGYRRLIDCMGMLEDANRPTAPTRGAREGGAVAAAQRLAREHRLRFGKKAAQLVLELSVCRQQWSSFVPALRRYADFTAACTERSYEAVPLQPAVLNLWVRHAPAAQLTHVDLWHRGLCDAVDDALFSAVFTRLATTVLPLRRIDRYLADAAAHARSVDAAFVWALHRNGAAPPAAIDRSVEHHLRSAVYADASAPELWPHVAPIIRLAPNNAGDWRHHLLVPSAGAAPPSRIALLVAICGLRHEGDAKAAALFAAHHARALRDPDLAMPLLAVLLRQQLGLLAAQVLVQVDLHAPGMRIALCRDVLRQLFAAQACKALQHVLGALNAAGLLFHSEIAAERDAQRLAMRRSRLDSRKKA